MNNQVKQALEEARKALRSAYETAVDEECSDSFIGEVASAYNIIQDLF